MIWFGLRRLRSCTTGCGGFALCPWWLGVNQALSPAGVVIPSLGRRLMKKQAIEREGGNILVADELPVVGIFQASES